jgi:hypothetical protein
MPVDITNVDQVRLDRESETLGARGVGSLFHFAHDSVVLTETQRYDHYRRMALLAFLRIGLSYYGRPAEVTPSGAMKAINQGKLLVNPLRWWSIGYSFLHSPTAEQNKAAYYQAVEGALWHKFEKRGTVDGEYIYRIPEDFDIEAHVTRLRAIFLLNVLMRKVHSKPIGTINDVRKIMMKIKSLLRIVLEGQLDIDKLFEVSEESRIGEQEAG